ncbi:MAG: hypothetical protein K2G70_01300, partial [Turicibacter sp.]|nr:hypothetical protein [Turicibacter sp.]
IGVAQIELNDLLEIDNSTELLRPNSQKLPNVIRNAISKAANLNLSLFLLPELSGDVILEDTLQLAANEYNMVIIGGSYYNSGRINCCPIAIPGESKPYIVQKINPSPYELSPNKNEGAIGGKDIFVFQNTEVGSFGVLICNDFLEDQLLDEMLNYDLDYLCVISMNNDSDRFFEVMNSKCDNSASGIYILYSNCLFSTSGITTDGQSSIFGMMNRVFLKKLNKDEEYKYKYKLASFSSQNEEGILVAKINLEERRPKFTNHLTKPNVSDIEKITFNSEGE